MEKAPGVFDLPYRSHAIAALESTIVVLFTILSVLGNTFIIAAFFHLKSLRTIPNILVVNLSIVDFLSAVTTHPLLASVLIRGTWSLGHEACKYQAILNSFLFITKNLSITFITLNRYLIIVRYKKYTNMFTKRSTRLFLVAIWVSSCFLALSSLMAQDEAKFHDKEALCVISSKNSARSVVIVILEHIVFLATIYLNCAILSLVRLHRKQVFSFFNKYTSPSTLKVTPAHVERVNCRSNPTGTQGTVVNRNDEPHIARKVFTVTTFYTIHWLPQGILKIASLTSGDFAREIWMTSTFCMQLSSVLNPILYGLLNRKLRKTIFGMLGIKAKKLIQVTATEVSTRRLQMRTLKGAFTVSRAGA